MKRKQLSEERELRRHLHRHYIVATKYDRELSRLITALVRAVRADEREKYAKEPGEVIVEGNCPACGVKLSLEYGDDEGEIVFLTKKGKSNEPERCSVSRTRQKM